MYYFTSDTHFSHTNIIKYCKRPWSTVEEMNESLIANYNSVVSDDDTVIHIGDYAMGPKLARYSTLNRLNGRIILVRGNHDEAPIEKLKEYGFDEVYTSYIHRDLKHGDILCQHVPNPMNEYKYHFCGHVHQEWMHMRPNIINVGVDVRGYMPVTADEIITLFLQGVETKNSLEPRL